VINKSTISECPFSEASIKHVCPYLFLYLISKNREKSKYDENMDVDVEYVTFIYHNGEKVIRRDEL